MTRRMQNIPVGLTTKKISFYKNFEAIDDLLRVSCVYGKVFTEPKDKLLMRVRSKEDHK